MLSEQPSSVPPECPTVFQRAVLAWRGAVSHQVLRLGVPRHGDVDIARGGSRYAGDRGASHHHVRGLATRAFAPQNVEPGAGVGWIDNEGRIIHLQGPDVIAAAAGKPADPEHEGKRGHGTAERSRHVRIQHD